MRLVNSKVSVNYAFTLTLKPKLYLQSCDKQYDMLDVYVLTKLKSFCEDVTIVCELTKSANIHFHGICNFILNSNQKKPFIFRFKDNFRNDPMIGFVDVKQITDLNRWIEYISKNLQETYDCIDRRPIIYDGYEIFTKDQIAKYGCQW